MELFINNRRYIGSKKSLLNQIQKAILNYYGKEKCVLADIFAGTGVVAEHFMNQGYDIIVNDFLYSNFIAYKTWISDEKINEKKVAKLITDYNKIDGSKLEENYFSKIYADKYFSNNDAKKIGHIRELIEKEKKNISDREYYAILTSLMYATDKIANTVGHFEHFLSKKPIDRDVELRVPFITKDRKSTSKIYNEDANELVKKINADIVYIDPPYNARQYINFYHVLENLVNWNKPTEFEGTSMKFKREHLKSGYSKSKAPELMKDLVDNIDAKLIIVSYNNTYNARSGASNNKISEEQLKEILESKGKTTVIEIDYKSFNAGKTNFANHKEKLYICEVGEAK